MADRTPVAPLDVRELLATLHRHGVEYTVIGGVAVQVHGHRRTTMDLDVIPGPERANLERLAPALADPAAHPRALPGAQPRNAHGEAPTGVHPGAAPIPPPLTTDHGELHILRDVPGAPPYADLRA